MVETSEFNEGASSLKEGAHKVLIGTETGTVRLLGGEGRSYFQNLGNYGDAFAVGAALSLGLTQWDYVHDRDNLRKQYDLELSAKLGKPYHELTNKDLDSVGKQNLVIGDALKRARTKRNIGLAVGVLAMAVAFAVGIALSMPAVLSAVGLAGAPATLTGAGGALSLGAKAVGLFFAKAIPIGIASIVSYMGTEKAANAIANPIFGMKEPSLHKVIKDPALQEKLSLSSQVNYLEHLQKRVRPDMPQTFIAQEQVFNVFLAANAGVANAIRKGYGDTFSALAPEQRIEIMQGMGKQINLEQITADLNNHQMRAQELAFLVQGDTSGVPRFGPPVTTADRTVEPEIAAAPDIQKKEVIGKHTQRALASQQQASVTVR